VSDQLVRHGLLQAFAKPQRGQLVRADARRHAVDDPFFGDLEPAGKVVIH
jgi:hypothetical protein